MKLMINHQTHYNYTETAKNSIQYIKMMPQTSLHQHVVNWAISVPGDKTLKRDIFNNIWLTATQRYEYQHLTFMAQGIVELLNTEIGGVDVPIPSKIFLQSTAATQYDSEMLDFAQKIVTVKDRQHIALLSENILQKMPYQPDSHASLSCSSRSMSRSCTCFNRHVSCVTITSTLCLWLFI